MILAIINIYLGFYLLCVNTMTLATFTLLLFFLVLLYIPHEFLRWTAPFGAFLGGIGFSYKKLSPNDEPGIY